ncbi:MAG TPA: hypothetical protein DEA08_18840 [Planctomycetes bacterium]|nr:hypothetical protein [Planctomycetota bacterium]
MPLAQLRAETEHAAEHAAGYEAETIAAAETAQTAVHPGMGAEISAATAAPGETTVARRIVLRRTTWERLSHLAEALEDTRGIDVTPMDVAVVALEAGLREVEEGLRNPNARKRASSSASSTQKRRKSKSGSTTRRRRALKLSDEERAQLEALLVDQRSTRARQRTIALWLGHTKRKVDTEHLRQLSVDYDAYNVANFAQNMKKDGACFKEKKDPDGRRMGWRLSKLGREKIKEMLGEALSPR